VSARSRRIVLRATVAVSCIFGVTAGPSSANQLALTASNLSAYRTCTVTPTTGTSTAGVDARVQQANGTNNYGTATVLNVDYGGSSNNVRTYLRFDLTKCTPAIPSTASIDAAYVRLFTTGIPGSGSCVTQDIFRVTTSWSETTLTWSNQPFGTATNNPTQSARTSWMNIGNGSGCQNASSGQYVSGWDVTTDVRAFVTGTSNFGWMIRPDTEDVTPARSTSYAARETNNANRSPQLIVDYR
jgi:hypothetical protein